MAILNFIITCLLIAAVFLTFVPRTFRTVVRGVAIAATFISAALAIKIFLQFQTALPDYQFVYQRPWV